MRISTSKLRRRLAIRRNIEANKSAWRELDRVRGRLESLERDSHRRRYRTEARGMTRDRSGEVASPVYKVDRSLSKYAMHWEDIVFFLKVYQKALSRGRVNDGVTLREVEYAIKELNRTGYLAFSGLFTLDNLQGKFEDPVMWLIQNYFLDMQGEKELIDLGKHR